jgi:hypothetical protein
MWAVVGALLAIGVGAWAGSRGPMATADGGARLSLDREVIDLGDLPFSAPARAVFTLTNTGTGPLRILEPPRVRAVQGC